MGETSEVMKVERDVVAVGGGAGGLSAAIAACEAGARATVLDKAPDLKNSSTSRAGGFFELQPGHYFELAEHRKLSPEERIRVAMEATEGHADLEAITTLYQNCDDTAEWLESLGFMFSDDRTTVNIPRYMARQAWGAGYGVQTQLQAIAEDMGCEILLNHRASKLLTDATGRVIGVRASTPEGDKDFYAKGIVLATGGFQANPEMLTKYMGSDFAHRVRVTGSPYATGDGIKMLHEVGAKLINMDQYFCRTADKTWRPGLSGQIGPFRALYTIWRFSILVNKLGKRFIDEAWVHDSQASSIMLQPDSAAALVFDEEIRKRRPDECERYEKTIPGIIITAQTLEELAQKIEVPYQALKATIDEFNHAIKDEKVLDLDITKSAQAVKIETPPFYAVYPIWGGLNCSVGGVKINSDAQVVDTNGMPIPGLYATGEMVGGLYWGKTVVTPGGAVYRTSSQGVVSGPLMVSAMFGRIAGKMAFTKN